MNTEDSEFARIEREQAMRNVPDAIHHTDTSEPLMYIKGWNDCRQAMLADQPAPVQQEPVAWPIKTNNQVEALAKQCGWDNRRYMTPADYQIWCERMRQFVQLASPQAQPAQHTDDTKRLDALAKNSWDLRCFDMPTGADDADIGWRVIEHHMSKPNERTVAEVFRDDPRQAIDAAIEAAHNIKENQS